METSRTSSFGRRYLRLLLVAMAIAGCLFVIRATARYGFSQVLIAYSLTAGNLTAAKQAVQITPQDAEAHFAAASLLAVFGTPEEAGLEIERAVALRPNDYVLWFQLGLLRDQIGDTTGSLKAFDESVERAPYYSLPRWNRGNVLLRSGQYEAAFNDLTQAAKSNPELIPNLVDLAWGVSRGDVKLTEQLAQINNDKLRIAFARVLARRGKGPETIAQLGAVAKVPDEIKRELVELLLAKDAFKEAFDIWLGDHGETGTKLPEPSIYDGGFEGSLAFGEGGFGWRVPHDLQGTTLSLDSSQPQSGAKDLRVEFRGNSNPTTRYLSQMILVEPTQRYKISFSSRSQDVVSGGLPLVIATDASGDLKRLGQSPALAKGTSDWQVYSFELTTSAKTHAVLLSLQRENCTTSPCPIFGSISLDSFSVEKLN